VQDKKREREREREKDRQTDRQTDRKYDGRRTFETIHFTYSSFARKVSFPTSHWFAPMLGFQQKALNVIMNATNFGFEFIIIA
jgi:hypothetical protein